MKKSLLLLSLLTLVLLVVGCPSPGGGGPGGGGTGTPTPDRTGSPTSTAGMEYVFTPDTYSIGSPYIWGLTYGSGKYVAAGMYGTVIASSNGTDWNLTQQQLAASMVRTPNNGGAHLTRARSMAGSSLGVAGKNLPAGRSLIYDSYGTDTQDDFVGVAYGAGKFVAVGFNGYAYSSTNGTDWVEIDGLPQNYDWSAFESIAFLNGKFIAFGYDYGTGYSVVMTLNSDGSWTSANLNYTDIYAGAAYGNGVYVAVTYNDWGGSPIHTSTDGSAWTPVPQQSISATDFVGEGVYIQLASVAFHDGVFVAVGEGQNNQSGANVPVVLISTDGTNWSMQDLPDMTPYGLAAAAVAASATIRPLLTGVTATDAGFVAVGDFYFWNGTTLEFASSIVMASTTGRSWQHDYYNSSLSGAVTSGNGLTAIGLGESFYSQYVNWVNRPM